MKAIKVIGVALLAFVFTGNAVAQRTVAKPTSTSSTAVSNNQEYFTDVKTLATFFIDGKIPASFPKYDSNLDKETNKKAVAVWAKKSENFELLSETGIAKLEKFNTNQVKKNTKK